jgi:hypothetical protein
LPSALASSVSGSSLGLFSALATDASGGGLVAQAPEGEIVKAGEEITFDGEGQVISRTRMSQARFQEVIESNMDGQELLPESLAIFQTYKLLYGQSTPSVMAVTGAQWLFDARNPYPRLRAGDALVIPKNRLKNDNEDQDNNESDSDAEPPENHNNTSDNPTPPNNPDSPTNPPSPEPNTPPVTPIPSAQLPDQILIFGP